MSGMDPSKCVQLLRDKIVWDEYGNIGCVNGAETITPTFQASKLIVLFIFVNN